MPLTILADDLTGACDTGCLFSGRGRVSVFIEPASPAAHWEVAAVDTESRSLTATDAARRVREVAVRLWARRAAGGGLFKKIDSTFRGAIPAELDAILSVTALRAALVCPAFPDQRRTVLHGVLHVDGAPAHESAVGRDPDYPGATSDLLDIVSARGARRVSHVPLKAVRASHADLVSALDRACGDFIVADAETTEDLGALARAATASSSLLLAGSAGLAGALATELGYSGAAVPLPAPGAWLFVTASLHPATRAQIGALAAAGVTGIWLEQANTERTERLAAALADRRPAFIATREAAKPPAPGQRAETVARVARVVARVLARAAPDLVAVTGGDTACALARELGAERIELLGAPSMGLALGAIVVNGVSTVPVLTKAGGFGRPDLFLTLLEGSPP